MAFCARICISCARYLYSVIESTPSLWDSRSRIESTPSPWDSGIRIDTFHSSVECLGPCNKHVFFTGRTIYRMVCMICLAFDGAALFGVCWRDGFSSLKFTAMTGMVGFCPVGIFRSVTTFVYLFRNLHALKHLKCILVGPSLKILAL